MAHLGYWIRYFYFLDYISGQRVHQPDKGKNQEMSLAYEPNINVLNKMSLRAKRSNLTKERDCHAPFGR
jgi:hypothetical protein